MVTGLAGGALNAVSESGERRACGGAKGRNVGNRRARNEPRQKSTHKEDDMGFMDDAKDAAQSTGEKVGDWVDEQKERASDKVDELQAEAEVKKAEAHRDEVKAKNEYKEELRDS